MGIETRKPVISEESAADKAEDIAKLYESDCYGIQAMRETLPPPVFKKIREVVSGNKDLDSEIAEMVANGMKEWALKKGATHYTHWFQPLTGSAAEKHDSFISILPGEERLLIEFSDEQLIKGEPDASSFPSGGLRSTWEARGYTVWDATSPAFIWKGANGSIMSIPTAFCSWTGEALDMKTPLLRSMDVLSKESVLLLNMMGEKCSRVFPTLGIEQEFFMIDRAFYHARPDLVATGRTLLGAKPSKGQELEDHYFATMNQRIMACMQEVEWKMWKLGMPIKTRHNEVAPAQYEFAPIFERSNVAGDHNMLLMEVLRTTAVRHNFVALLHEKPFAGVNGSGKHNNWSVSTDTGKNLLNPGDTPQQNARFILFLTAIIRAVDIHADLLRCSVANPGNDHRLGANEAPPAVISIYLGEQLDEVVNRVMNQTTNEDLNSNPSSMELGTNKLPPLPRDATDRNRTSPFAFTGNKFEFRAVGSSQAVAFPNIVMNSIVAESLRFLRTEIAAVVAKGVDFNKAMQQIARDTLKKHYRVVFNGDGYSEEWLAEAARRGLPNYHSTSEALGTLSHEKNVKLFESLNVMSKVELISRQHVMYENYNKTMMIEARCLANIVTTSVVPAVLKYQTTIAASVASVAAALGEASTPQKALLKQVSSELDALIVKTKDLKELLTKLPHDQAEEAAYLHTIVTKGMQEVRQHADELELICDNEIWPLPKYAEILFLR